jgi:uncharacterized protein YciI
MLFVVTCMDKPGSLQSRLDARPDHLAYLAQLKASVKLAGPFLGSDNQTPIGSLLIYECASSDEARSLLENDPFFKTGLFANVEIKAWRQGAGTPLG